MTTPMVFRGVFYKKGTGVFNMAPKSFLLSRWFPVLLVGKIELFELDGVGHKEIFAGLHIVLLLVIGWEAASCDCEDSIVLGLDFEPVSLVSLVFGDLPVRLS